MLPSGATAAYEASSGLKLSFPETGAQSIDGREQIVGCIQERGGLSWSPGLHGVSCVLKLLNRG